MAVMDTPSPLMFAMSPCYSGMWPKIHPLFHHGKYMAEGNTPPWFSISKPTAAKGPQAAQPLHATSCRGCSAAFSHPLLLPALFFPRIWPAFMTVTTKLTAKNPAYNAQLHNTRAMHVLHPLRGSWKTARTNPLCTPKALRACRDGQTRQQAAVTHGTALNIPTLVVLGPKHDTQQDPAASQGWVLHTPSTQRISPHTHASSWGGRMVKTATASPRAL